MKALVEKLPKSAVKLTVTVGNSKVKEAYKKILSDKVKTTKVEGFRQGKAPNKMVEDKLGASDLYGDVINELLQTHYVQAVKEKGLLPISNPKITVGEFDLEKDFEFTAEIAIKPDVEIKEFRKDLKKLYLKKKKKDEKARMMPNDVIDVILENSKIEIADVLAETETNRLITQLAQQAKGIGLTMEQYLKAQDKTLEQLQKEYEKVGVRNLKAEFALSYLIEKEKVEISEDEISKAIEASGVSIVQAKTQDPRERLYVKSILQKNKYITNLMEETEKK